MSDDPIMDEAADAIQRISDEERANLSREERLARDRRPETAAIQHGLWMRDGAALLCDRCRVAEYCEYRADGARCPVEVAYMERRRKEVRGIIRDEGDAPDHYAAAIGRLIYAEVRFARAQRYLSIYDEFDPNSRDYNGVAKQIPALQRACEQAEDQLHLSRAAQVKLRAQRDAASGGGKSSMTGLVIEADARAVDVEFEDEGGDGDGSGLEARATDDQGNDHGSMEGDGCE